MLIIPAIDLHDGCCVRLKQGQFDQATVYQPSPQELAKHYASLGVSRLHVVDLDGAKSGAMQQLELIQSLQTTSMTLQVGGGIRSLNAAKECIASGIANLVLGSIAVSNPTLTGQLITKVNPQNIVLALDVHIKSGTPCPAIHGWQTATSLNAWDVVQYYLELGVTTVLCTDIAQDGMMSGPNFTLYKEAVRRFPTINWQASGGIRGMDDIKCLADIGVAAVILGRVLYEPEFDLPACLEEFA